jgi:hypothetical protein
MTTHLHSASSRQQLQTELRDLAFLLDRQGSYAAAELAVSLAAGFDELLPAPALRVETCQEESS